MSKHLVDYSVKHFGYCVYKPVEGKERLLMEFISGPYMDERAAEIKAKGLDEVMRSGE